MPTRSCARRVVTIALLVASAGAHAADTYKLAFELSLQAGKPRAEAAIELRQKSALLREARFRAPAPRFDDFAGDGEIERDGDFVTWTPPRTGGRITYTVDLENERDSGRFDSLVTQKWALFRADDAFPPARVRHRSNAHSKSTLKFSLPGDWTVITPFAERPTGGYLIDNPDRAFDRPTGWLIAGKLGRRKDMIAGIEVSIAAPVGAGVERVSMLALLRWTLPDLARELGELPPRISIVAAGAPMWRGGLSAPNSMFLHADRPLLSENATSTLLHEVVHVLMPVRTKRDQDWIDEGIAEYVTLRLLRDSNTISVERFDKALAGFAARGKAVDTLVTPAASGAVRARAVTIIAALDAEIEKLTDRSKNLFDLVRAAQAADEPLDADALRNLALELTGAAEINSLETIR
ncbi:MAG: hypothetical protein ACN4GT_00175 [Gammaproteobacteria bacterium]